jgi:cytochrome c oxidase subunit III
MLRAEHFVSGEQELAAARLGMWLFLLSEVLLFGGLFTCYATYRALFPQTFAAASRHLHVAWGTLNTAVLLTSSLTVALAVHFARTNRSRKAAAMLGVSLLLASAFLVIKGIEYSAHFEEHALPGKYFALAGLDLPGASMFFTLYFFMTGLHALHVVAGMGALSYVGLRALRGHFSAGYYTPVELGGLYWHLVDIVWIFLYPLLYLI